MNVDSISVRNGKTFKDWAGFDEIRTINLIIGKNNSGKSRLLDFVREVCVRGISNVEMDIRCSGQMTEEVLKQVFQPGHPLRGVRGDPWRDIGRNLVGKNVSFTLNKSKGIFDIECKALPQEDTAILPLLMRVIAPATSRLDNCRYLHLASERDIQPENFDVTAALKPDGKGATAVMRLETNSASKSHELVEVRLKGLLNQILGDDEPIVDIRVKQNDGGSVAVGAAWEVYLTEKHKGSVPLSMSGSGLKTIILALLHLFSAESSDPARPTVLAFEELENNLHPSVLRRLLKCIERVALEKGHIVFLTTHSSVMVDFFAGLPHASVVCVSHDGTTARTHSVSSELDLSRAIAELGAKPSDLLQANGIIWVEGPSDRIYMNRFIELVSKGALREGKHYQCACYGGSNLANLSAGMVDSCHPRRVDLYKINKNIVVVSDSDRASAADPLKDSVTRVGKEVASVDGFHWITNCREMENYLPGSVLEMALNVSGVRDPKQFEAFWPRVGDGNASFLAKVIKRKSLQKVDLALGVSHFLTLESLQNRFDLVASIEDIVSRIREWNS